MGTLANAAIGDRDSHLFHKHIEMFPYLCIELRAQMYFLL